MTALPRSLGILAFLLAASLPSGSSAATSPEDIVRQLKLPPGFHIDVFASGLDGARSMALGTKGTLFVGTRGGSVYAVRPSAGGGSQVLTIARGLNAPNGVAFRDGALYVAETNRIQRFDNIENQLDHPPKPVLVSKDLPSDGHHGWRYLAFGPDGWLYVPIGAPCNICNEKGYAVITRMRADGSLHQEFAHGVRNTVGFTWDPRTKEMWFTDNGRDYLGDDAPSDELNHAPRAGLHFGYPFCHAGDIPDPEFGKQGRCADFTPPAQKLGAHVASIGLRFYTGSQFPEEYRNDLFIAEHGSWNRSERSGYQVVRVPMKDGRAQAPEPFVTGWNQKNAVLGRPVDVLVATDGALLVSDDLNGLVWRITYRRD
jgi:glucose/arabinose dehydrogenase